MMVAGPGSSPCGAAGRVHPSSSHQDLSLELCPAMQFGAIPDLPWSLEMNETARRILTPSTGSPAGTLGT